MKILALEPYYGGSHRAFLDTLIHHSRHTFHLISLPARKWKWRMRGAAMWFAERLRETPVGEIDLIFTCDMVSVAELRALLPANLRTVPVCCYFHENQLTYPLSEHDRQDYQFGFTNITSCLASDAVWFNSAAHRDAFLDATRELLRLMPDHVPTDVVTQITNRSRVMWPLVEWPADSAIDRKKDVEGPPVILWSHRWEYDKNPEAFFRVLFRLVDDGVDFRLVLLGESFRRAPEVFGDAWSRLRERIVHGGFVERREDYWRLLASCDIVVSTAIQENFGLAMVEAIAAGCHPVLPRRLSYPELIPLDVHADCLYDDDDELHTKLTRLVTAGPPAEIGERLRQSLRDGCGSDRCIFLYDKALDSMSRDGTR